MSDSDETKESAAAQIAGLKLKLSCLESSVAKLKESEEKYRSLADQANDGIVLVQDMVVKFANARLAEMVGYEQFELVGLPFEKIVSPDELPRVTDSSKRRLSGENVTPTYEAALRHKEGKKIIVEFNSGLVPFEGKPAELVVIRDITDSLNLREQLLQAQKMEVVGRLADGMAHDFNNLLMAVINYSALIKAELPVDSRLRDDVEQIFLVGNRAMALIRQLLVFSRRQITEPKLIDVNELLVNMNKMLRHLIRADIELVVIPEAAHPFIEADPSQVEQIIINLVINAKDAMPEGGKLTVMTADFTANSIYDGIVGSFSCGNYLVFSINDTGSGINEMVRKHIFEPFFTTKDPGRGTGLGLSTVQTIVKHYNGVIELRSAYGEGTTFKVYFPVSKKCLAREVKTDDSDVLSSGDETVLVVEDDSSVRDVIVRMLIKLGYNVLAASHGEEAIQIARDYTGKIKLVIINVFLPRMTGRATIGELSVIIPGLKVIFISGYSDDADFRKEFWAKGAEFLPKPFFQSALALKVRETLDSKIS